MTSHIMTERLRNGKVLEINWVECIASELSKIDWEKLWETGEPVPDSYAEKPFPNEHACRIRSPRDFKRDSFRRVERGEGRNLLFLILGRLRGQSTATLQAFRYPKEVWDAPRARAHCRRHDGQSFEPATRQGGQHVENELNLDTVYSGLMERGQFWCHPEIKEVKEMDDGTLVIRGLANTKNIDRVRDIVEPAAFRRSLSRFKKTGKILRGHNPGEPIGKARDAEITDQGLFLEAGIPDAPIVYLQEARAQIQEGLMDSFSVGFQILKSKPLEGDDVPAPQDGRRADRRITDLDLFEVSVVTIPANVQSRFDLVKSIEHGTDLYLPTEGRYMEQYPAAADQAPVAKEQYAATARYIQQLTESFDASEDKLDVQRAIAAIRGQVKSIGRDETGSN